jgi:HAD superfamily hydrolase (TIGR01549 family)
MTNIVRLPDITHINFELLRVSGVTNLFTDIESTLAPYGDSQIDPYTAEFLESQRAVGNIATISLITNRRDPAFAKHMAEQLGADAYLCPTSKDHRKPAPHMLHEAARMLGVSISSAVMVGDKLTGDMHAARSAGVPYAVWVDRLGSTDHPGDRYLRRPYERLHKRRYPDRLLIPIG